MRTTKRTNLAIRVLLFCALHSERLVTKSEAAQRCNASENHLAQVINQLGRMGFLITHRGRNGGLELARSSESITLGEIFRAMESPDPINESFSDFNTGCSASTQRLLGEAVRAASECFFASLDGKSLAGMIADDKCSQTHMSQTPLKPSRIG